MTRLLLLIIITGLAFGCQDANTSAKKLTAQKDTLYLNQPKDSIIELQVRLIDKLDTIQLPAYCGLSMQRMTLNYQVIKVLSGQYHAETMFINHTCPRESVESKMIQNDKTYTYKVKRRFVNSYTTSEKPKAVDAGDYEIVRSKANKALRCKSTTSAKIQSIGRLN